MSNGCTVATLVDIIRGDGITGRVPDTQDAHMPFVFSDVKDDSVSAVPSAVQQMAGGKTKLFCFGDDGAAGGKFVQAEHGLE
jgi:hypothetical protein